MALHQIYLYNTILIILTGVVMRIVLASMLALGLGSAPSAFAADSTTPRVASPGAHSVPMHKHTHATKPHKRPHKRPHNGSKREGK
jgi:hypothetical protein